MNNPAFIKQDEISHYLKDVRKIKVMTPAREKELSKIIQNPKATDEEIGLVEKEILELKKINIHNPDISTEEASHNVGAVKYLTKVVELLEKDSKEFFG